MRKNVYHLKSSLITLAVAMLLACNPTEHKTNKDLFGIN